MGLNEQKLFKQILKEEPKDLYCFYSTEDYLLNTAENKTVAYLLSKSEAEITKINGPQPSIEEAVAAAGTISFFGTKRIVVLNKIEPGAMLQKDIDALIDLSDSLENACIVVTILLKDDKSKSGKKVKQIIDKAKKIGTCAELVKPTDADLKEIAISKAEQLGAKLSPQNASALIERCKNDAELIENETAKLAALSAYSEITHEMIINCSTLSVEADVFEMVRFVSAKNKAKAFEILQKLLQLQNEPIAIAAALSGSFVDVYRVKCASEKGKTYSVIYKEYGYTGSDYRLKKANETASRYSKKQLSGILNILLELDLQMKSSSVDNVLLLQTAVCEIIDLGAK